MLPTQNALRSYNLLILMSLWPLVWRHPQDRLCNYTPNTDKAQQTATFSCCLF